MDGMDKLHKNEAIYFFTKGLFRKFVLNQQIGRIYIYIHIRYIPYTNILPSFGDYLHPTTYN